MITNVAAQWILSAVFALTAAYSVFWIVKSWTARDRISYLTHALMSVAMFAMVWPWGAGLLLIPQIVVFSAATIWFLYLLAVRPKTAREHTASGGHHDGKRTLGYHAGMMAAMVVMGAAMTGMGTAEGTGLAPADAMGSMPGMDMSAGAASGMVLPLWAGMSALICALGFGIATLYYVGSFLASATADGGFSRPRISRTADAGWKLLMAAGMATLFVPMISFG